MAAIINVQSGLCCGLSKAQSGLLCGLLCGHFIFDNYMNRCCLGSQLSDVCAGFAQDLRASNRIIRISLINPINRVLAETTDNSSSRRVRCAQSNHVESLG
jgi:hypothetical protein